MAKPEKKVIVYKTMEERKEMAAAPDFFVYHI